MAVRVNRFDKGEMRKAERTPQGYLRAPAFVTRTGVLTYRFPDGSVRKELRHPDDVFNADSMASLAGVPVTNNHPPGLLDASNTKQYMAGYTGDNVAKDGNFIAVPLTITDDDLIKQVESGKTEISCGYACELDDGAGTYDGETYTHRQRNITYNHAAVVDRGRAGPQVSIHLDAADAEQVSNQSSEDSGMEKIVINGVSYDVASQVAQAYIAEQKVRKDAADKAESDAKAALAASVAKASQAEARADGAEAEVKKLKAEIATRADAMSPDKIRAAVKNRQRIELVANRTLDKETIAKMDAMDDKEIKLAVLKAEDKDTKFEEKDDAYIDARFDHLAVVLSKDPNAKVGADLLKGRQDSVKDGDAEAAAAQRQKERALTAWQGKKDEEKK